MSAAAGLSAARRRRAGSNNTNINNSRNTNRNTVVKQPSRRTIHPMQILVFPSHLLPVSTVSYKRWFGYPYVLIR